MNSLGARALFDEAVGLLDERLLEARGWVVHSRDFPLLDISFRDPERKELRLKITCDDWNDTPPSVTLCALDGTELAALPSQRPGSTIFASPHQHRGGPFICMIGSREYHTHGSHVGDHWNNYRAHSDYRLGALLDQFWRGWRSFWP